MPMEVAEVVVARPVADAEKRCVLVFLGDQFEDAGSLEAGTRLNAALTRVGTWRGAAEQRPDRRRRSAVQRSTFREAQCCLS